MHRALHLLIVLLLTAAIPLRAATAATMVLCGPIHERLAQNLKSDAHSDIHAHHGHADAQHAHSHQHGDVTHAHPGVASLSQPPDSHAGDAVDAVKHAQFKCAFCGACCAGGFVIPSSSLIVPAIDVANLAFPPLVFTFVGWYPGVLERPPHSPLV